MPTPTIGPMSTTGQPADETVADGAAQSVRRHPRARRWVGAMLGATTGLALTVFAVSPASASTFGMPSAAAGGASSVAGADGGQVCTVRATEFVKQGDTNVVTSTATSCAASGASGQAAGDSLVALSNVHVGYGCNGASFAPTCWWFDVPSPGCASSSSSWGWSTISQNNVLSSWEAVNTCSHGTLYDLPYYGGTHITCYTCYSLGSMNNLATSLKVFL